VYRAKLGLGVPSKADFTLNASKLNGRAEKSGGLDGYNRIGRRESLLAINFCKTWDYPHASSSFVLPISAGSFGFPLPKSGTTNRFNGNILPIFHDIAESAVISP